jgi:chromosomal replication initiation ATPase DnaA
MNIHVAISLRMSEMEAKGRHGVAIDGTSTLNDFQKRINAVKDVVMLVGNITEKQLKAQYRKQEVVAARNVFCYLCYHRKLITLSTIAKYLGKHHSSVIYSIKIVKNAIDTKDETIMNIYNKCLKLI